MHELFSNLARRPESFSVYTVKELWTRPHLAGKMLEYHLSQDTAHASRTEDVVERIVAWIDSQLDLQGKRICDLGCGPGLYARRMAGYGAEVTGVDFSAGSLEYARSRDSQSISYLEADYLQDDLPGGFDIVVLIYFDYCAVSPELRTALLGKIHQMLNPGGHLVLDLAGTGMYERAEEHIYLEQGLMDGFWAPSDYVGIQKTDRYPDDLVTLDRYVIIEPGETWQIFNWMQYFTPESATAELNDAGFMVKAMTAGLEGEPLEEGSDAIGVIAEKV